MASLVADYGESSGDSDGEDDSESACVKIEVGAAKEETSVNFFAENEDDDSDDSSAGTDQVPCQTEEKPEEENTPKLPNPFMDTKLPSPHLNSKKKKKSSSIVSCPNTSSVFVNPFEQAEQAKLGILEKHVRLTEAAPQKPASKQVCFKFKKGKCFLGEKCRFFHDRSNIPLGSNSERQIEEPEQDSGSGFGRGDGRFRFPGSGGVGTDGHFYHPNAHFSVGQPADPRVVDDDNYMAAAKRKKRYGVTDTLVPPKKAMMDLGSLRQQERPWTMKKK